MTLQTQFAQDRMQAFVTQTQQLFSVIGEAIQKSERGAMGAWMGAMPSNPMAVVFKDVQDRAMQIAKENAESVFAFAGKISNARTPQDIVTLQTEFAQDRMFWCFSLFRARPSKPTLSNVIMSFPKLRRDRLQAT